VPDACTTWHLLLFESYGPIYRFRFEYFPIFHGRISKMFLQLISSQQCLLMNTGLIIRRGCSIILGLILLSLAGCGADSEQGPTISTNSTPAGAIVSLAWDPLNDSNVIGYYIHYGKESPNQPGSCAYDQEQFVSSNQGTVTDLERGLIYYFAVSAYNGVEGNCSNEVFTST
jgi:hypothetical protein